MDVNKLLDKVLRKEQPEERQPRDIRRQFNVKVHPQIFEKVKRLVAFLRVNGSIIAEHALQVGLDAMDKTTTDPERREKLRKHLIEDHQLSDDLLETDEALHIVDTHYAADIIQMSHELVRRYVNLGKLMDSAQHRKISFDRVEEGKDRLTAAAFKLAIRLTRHPLDQEQSEPSFGEQIRAHLERSITPQRPVRRSPAPPKNRPRSLLPILRQGPGRQSPLASPKKPQPLTEILRQNSAKNASPDKSDEKVPITPQVFPPPKATS